MYFYMPVKVYSEDNCVRNHAAQIAALGTKALIVTGRHSAAANGSLQDVQDVLLENKISYVHFNEVEENPSVETIMKARDLGVHTGCNFVIGIGGGSPMDASKAISLMMRSPERGADLLYDKSAPTRTLPIVLIPTTCGTGSEVTAISVLTRHDLKTKGSIPHKIFADLALIDGKYLASASRKVIVNTTMDALAHLFESYINSKATDYSRVLVDGGLQVWARSKEVVLGHREATADDFRNMMNASMLAGMSIAHTGTAIPHALSYAVTYSAHMAHGKACGYFLPGYLRHADPAAVKHLLQLAGFDSIDVLEAYYEATCGRDEVPLDILERSVHNTLANPAKLAAAPFAIDEAVLRDIAGI